MDQTGFSSILLRILEFSSRRYLTLGAIAHQPTGFVLTYASIPTGCFFSTSILMAFLFPRPFCFSNSAFFNRQYIHQQPPHAPLSPKSLLNASQFEIESGLNCRFIVNITLRTIQRYKIQLSGPHGLNSIKTVIDTRDH